MQHCADNVLQLELHDASPWLFSVKSALSWPSILLGCLMLQQSLPCQPPSPMYVYRVCTSLSWKLEGNSCLLTKAKKFTFHSCLPFQDRWCRGKADERSYCGTFMILSWLHLRRLPVHGWAHLKCWLTTFLSTLNPLLLLIHQPPEMKIALQRDGVCPRLFSGCQDTLSFWWSGQQ